MNAGNFYDGLSEKAITVLTNWRLDLGQVGKDDESSFDGFKAKILMVLRNGDILQLPGCNPKTGEEIARWAGLNPIYVPGLGGTGSRHNHCG